MAREQISLGRGEAQAFQKIHQGLCYCIEGCVELDVYRCDRRWAIIGLTFEKLLKTVGELYHRAPSGRTASGNIILP